MLKRSRLSTAGNCSFLFFHFDFVLSSSSARYLQNLIVSKNVRNSQAAQQCDWLIVGSFLNYSVSFSTSSVRKARSISGLCLAHDRSMQAMMYLGPTLLEMQALRKAAENLRVLIFPLVLTTLFKTAICCLVYQRRKFTKILLVVQNFNIALKKAVLVISFS